MAFRLEANPIVVKELRSRMRGGKAFAMLTGFLLGLGVIAYGLFLWATRSQTSGAVLISSQIGQSLFAGLAFSLLVLICLITPAVTAGAISSERERLSYEMLIVTPLHPGRLLWGKLVSSMSYVFLLILAAVPLGSIIFLFGGVSPSDLLKAMLLVVTTAITAGTLGLFASALTRRTGRAAVLAYIVVALTLGGLLFLSKLWYDRENNGPVPTALLAPNPISGLASSVAVLTTPPVDQPGWEIMRFDVPVDKLGWGPGMQTFNTSLEMPGWRTISTGVWTEPTPKQLEQGLPFTPQVRPIWRDTVVIQVMVTLILFWLTLHLVRPRRLLRPGKEDLLMAIVSTGALLGAGLWRGWW